MYAFGRLSNARKHPCLHCSYQCAHALVLHNASVLIKSLYLSVSAQKPTAVGNVVHTFSSKKCFCVAAQPASLSSTVHTFLTAGSLDFFLSALSTGLHKHSPKIDTINVLMCPTDTLTDHCRGSV